MYYLFTTEINDYLLRTYKPRYKDRDDNKFDPFNLVFIPPLIAVAYFDLKGGLDFMFWGSVLSIVCTLCLRVVYFIRFGYF